MKIIRQFALPAALALGISSSLSAREPGGRGTDGPPPPDPIARALDANGDHVIDADEIAGASAALLTLDANNDGALSPDEIRPSRPPKDGADADGGGPPPEPPAGEARGHRPPPPDQGGNGGKGKNAGHRPPPPLLAALDTDHDGTISAAEIAAAPASLAKLDTNKDGKLDGRELRPGPARGGPGGRGGQGDQGGGGRPPRGNR